MLFMQSIPAWDLLRAVDNANKYAKALGPGLLVVMGVVGFCWGLGLLLKGWMGGQQSGPVPYGRAIALLIVGGACAWGSWSEFYHDVSNGSADTIKQIGGGNRSYNKITQDKSD